MNFSVPLTEVWPCFRFIAILKRLLREPTIRQIMRISVVFLALLLTSLQLLLATPGRGQGVESTEVILELKGESLEAALKKIEKMTPFRFVYRSKEIKNIDNLNLKEEQRSVADLLFLVLNNTSFTFRQINRNILIMKKGEERLTADEGEANFKVAEHTVSGKVTDQDNEALAGVSVILKGTTIGTATDVNGRYALTLPDGSGTLQFSYIGFTTEEVNINDRTVIDVLLTPDIKALSEIVVTALGISRDERSLGYATQEVKGENLTFTKEQNVIGSLSGKIAGVQVIGSSGASMGGTQKIKIRGVNTLTGADQPLIVLDGTPMANMNFASGTRGQDYGNTIQDINPADIESINVLKGPAASALYGLRGQHGVIMITTKKGAKGAKKVTVEYSGIYSVEKAGNFMPVQNIYGGGSSQTFSKLNDGTPYSSNSIDESWGPKMDGTPVRQFYSWFPADPDYGKTTPYVPHPDNIKDYYEVGNTFNNTLSISGGAENTSFRLSYNHTDINGVEPNTWLKRNNLGFNGSLDLTSNLQLSTSLNYANNSGQRPAQGYVEGTSQGASGLSQWFQRSVDMNRLKNYKYPDGSILHWNIRNPAAAGTLTNLAPLYWSNPYFGAYENFSQDNRDRYFGNVALSYELLKRLRVTGTVRSDMFTQNIDKRTAKGGVEVNDSYWIGKYQNQESNYEFLAEYNKAFGEISINAITGGNLMKQKYTYLYQETVGGLITPGFYNIVASVDRPTVSNYLRKKEIRSLFAMISAGYKNTWFIDASIRNDNSSALPEDNNSYYYPSISGSMVFSEFVPWQPLSFGKLRLSYAMAGNDLSPYQTTLNYQLGNVYASTPPVNSLYFPSTLNNPELEPSFSNSAEIGLDLKFLHNRIGASITFYHQENKNQVISLPVSGASGYTTALINAGLIENKGYEISLSATPLRTSRFSWDINFNIAKNLSTIKELYKPDTTIKNYQIASNAYAGVPVTLNARLGEAYGTLIGQAYKRDPATGKILLDAANLPMYEANHNFGSVLPDFTGGVQNTFSYGPVSLNAMIDFQLGGQFFSWSRMMSFKTGLAKETAALNDNGMNVRDPVPDGGGVKVTGISNETGEEVSAYVDARTYYRSRLGTQVYEEWLYDASFIRLREVRLGYSFDKNSLGKLPVSRVNVALIAQNPLMIWQKAPQGLNPAELAKGSEAISWLETGQLITVRSYGVSLNVSF